MKIQRPFQLFILIILASSLLGSNGRVYASLDIVDTGPSVTTTINPLIVDIGETAVVSVSLNNIPPEGYGGAEFTCSIDYMEASNLVTTDVFGSNPVTVVNDPGDGTFIVAIAGSQGQKAMSGGTVFTFSVKSMYAGLAWVECTARVSNGDNTLQDLSTEGTVLIISEGVPTPSPLTPTIAPTACDKAQFIANITIPSGTVLSPGETFLKTWRFMNLGSCDWNYYDMVFVSGEVMNEYPVFTIPLTLHVGETIDISLEMVAPLQPGSYHGYWMFRNNQGALFGVGSQGNQPFSVDINVAGPTVTPGPATHSPTPTATHNPSTRTPFPSVTPGGPTATRVPDTAFDFVANACSADWLTFASYPPLPCPGIENETTGYILKLDHPILETGLADSRPGLLVAPSIRQNWVGEYIQGVYPPLTVRSGDRFRTTISCEGGAMDCDVTFRLDYQIVSSSDTLFHTFWSFIERDDGETYSADVDLSPLVGQEVKFALTVLSNGSTITDDRGLWIAPMIYRAGADFTPTPTVPYSTTTPSEEPGIITISGKVLSSKPVTISIYNGEDSLISEGSVNSDGSFGLAVFSGTYSVRAEAVGALDARSDFVLNYREIHSMQTITLPAGDIDDNNLIDQFDALTIGMNYNVSSPDAADLNNDGIINVLDLQLLAVNYQKSGPIPWQ